ncbi:phosphogluconate dehydratase [Pseudonocardia oroxyli]|uniref:Phosphogluconate dehydratase n=1 Tax=Pseudonocardia oroxyli TaxID=366584 RepID=A0A1G7SVA9_PSEOR|nr:phosphogluconate dehydratase [Pseudonocardia oroxyli]SDG26792.1 6-phosphogluconate dehydratase [Pseudonocardia oroxyli]
MSTLHRRTRAAELHPVVRDVTDRIRGRSATGRADYLARIRDASATEPGSRRAGLGCANLAHGVAACGGDDRARLLELTADGGHTLNLAIVTSYNDMLSAHQPFGDYPDRIKQAVRTIGGVAQVAGGVPAMCDGITQGRPGMELSLFSRDVIAMSTAIALSHDMFDAAALLGVCDKIVPGLVMGALAFGHLPAVLVPAGPMSSGLPNDEKSRVRRRHAAGEIGRDELLEAETRSYHSPGTCTFYGTANSNQLLMDVMGLHLPGAAFVPPATPLRAELTAAAARQVLANRREGVGALGELVDERTIVNAVVALLATGGSTNHTMHLVAMAGAAGIDLTWDDFDDLSAAVPLVARIYPNGRADVNHFHAAGGTPVLIGSLLDAGLLHPDVTTVVGKGLDHYRREPHLDVHGCLAWRDAPLSSADRGVLRGIDDPFAPDGGLRTVRGNLGRAVVKVSAVDDADRVITAPAQVFDEQVDLRAAFDAGRLRGDMVVVIRHQGPRANGMPELHGLTPVLEVLRSRGQRVALVTDGRMSGASGAIPAAIHCTPEASAGGPLARVRDGDPIRLDTRAGTLDVLGDLDTRSPAPPPTRHGTGTGRELFAAFRAVVGPAEQGAVVAR